MELYARSNPILKCTRSVVEAPVLVLAEESDADAGQGIGLEDLEPLVEGVVDVDLAAGTSDDDAARSASLAYFIYISL